MTERHVRRHPAGPPEPAETAEALRRPRAPRRRRAFDVREWRVRTKLVAVLVIPTVAFLGLAGVNLVTLVIAARSYAADTRAVDFGRDVSVLVHRLQRERDLSAGFFVDGSESAERRLAAQRHLVDRAVERYREVSEGMRPEAGAQLSRTLVRIDRDLTALPRLRDAVTDSSVTQSAAMGEYSGYVADLLDVVGGVTGQGDPELTQRIRVLVAFAEAKERASQARGTLFALALRDRFGTGQHEQLTTALANERSALDRFEATAGDNQRALASRTVRGQAVLTVSQLEEAAQKGGRAGPAVDPQQWLAASSARQKQMHEAERLLLDRVVERSRELTASATQRATVTGPAIAGIVLVSLLLSLVIARSMARGLTQLRRGALDIAQEQLPDAVARIREGQPGQDAEEQVPSLNVHSRDEVGQVAAAFDAVHRQAVRLAGEQAMLRRDVNTLFVNFSRRSQSLVERQLSLIDELEAQEQSPEALDNLFRLDHLATRMRRNNESLLVIAGSDTTRRWTRPVPLREVVLAAISEIEQFTRVTQKAEPDMAIAGHAVSDVVHMLAELLENATRSSPPTSHVTVSGRAIRAGTEALIEIEDSGIGMTKAALQDANRRLGNLPGQHVPSGPQMGLFIVTRLARRYGIVVELAESSHGGLVAQVRIPAALVTRQADPGVGSESDGDATADAPARPVRPERQDASGHGDGRRETGRRTSREADVHPTGRDDDREGAGPDDDQVDDSGVAATPARLQAARRSAMPSLAEKDEMPTVVLSVFDSVSEWFASSGRAAANGTPRPTTADLPVHAGSGRPADQASAFPDARGAGPDRSSPAADGPPQKPEPDRPADPPAQADRAVSAPRASQGSGADDGWASSGDAGWAAAQGAASPGNAGLTSAGLPIRRPRAHFVPGSSGTRHNGEAAAPAPTRAPRPAPAPVSGFGTASEPGRPASRATPSSPDQVRGLLSTYYRGVREARQTGAEPSNSPRDAESGHKPARPPTPNSTTHEGEST
ncbi:MAG: nitrate- and nitrite sensing domain-containing protein [Actinomycetes bacterium]